MSLIGKVALVTGAGRGIGQSIALRLADEGADVSAADIDRESAERTAADVRARARRAVAVRVDVSDVTQVEHMVESTCQSLGRIDILVNNAGVWGASPLLELTPEEWDRVFAVNTRGLFFCLQRAGKRMMENRSGTIINIASIAGLRSRPEAVHYGASKAAALSITRAAAPIFAPFGITVNAVCPGRVETPMNTQAEKTVADLFGLDLDASRSDAIAQIPLGRVASPNDIAGVVAFLASPDAAYITGHIVNVSGGLLIG